jgi:hypothetical protein
MGCLLAVIAAICPRILMFFILLTSDWFSRAYDTFIWPFLGFLFMPYTTLAYMAAMLNNHHSVDGWWAALMIIAIISDLSSGAYEIEKRR